MPQDLTYKKCEPRFQGPLHPLAVCGQHIHSLILETERKHLQAFSHPADHERGGNVPWRKQKDWDRFTQADYLFLQDSASWL